MSNDVDNRPRARDPLEGKTLAKILESLVAQHGWAELARALPIRCFLFDPSIPSSLKFLRRTPWARSQLEEIYRASLGDGAF